MALVVFLLPEVSSKPVEGYIVSTDYYQHLESLSDLPESNT